MTMFLTSKDSNPLGTHDADYKRSCLKYRFDMSTHICMTVSMGLSRVQVHNTNWQIHPDDIPALDDSQSSS